MKSKRYLKYANDLIKVLVAVLVAFLIALVIVKSVGIVNDKIQPKEVEPLIQEIIAQ